MHELAVFLNEHLEVSVSFYKWLKYTTLAYRYDPEQNLSLRNSTSEGAMLYGVSLHAPRVSQVRETWVETKGVSMLTEPTQS